MKKFSKSIRDDVHGDIIIESKLLIDLINTKEFQRLRRIIQLGGGQFVFPSANHTRFSHSIGVYHVLTKFLENENISSNLKEDETQILLAAGLLHDIGHGPFSHSFEGISIQPHEKYSVDIILGNTEINEVLKKAGVDPKEIAKAIEGKHNNFIVNLLVSSQLDADRLDYLLRDSKNAGVTYSTLDLNWIIKNVIIEENKMVYPEKTLHAIEGYLLGRYYMYKQVYNHSVSESFDITLNSWFKRLKDLYNEKYEFKFKEIEKIFEELFNNKPMNLQKYISLDDYSMSYIFKQLEKEDDFIIADFSKRILNRNFLRSIEIENIEEIKLKLVAQKYNLDYYFIEKEIVQFNLYKTNNTIKDEQIYIKKNNGNIIALNEISNIINSNVSNSKQKIYFLPKEVN